MKIKRLIPVIAFSTLLVGCDSTILVPPSPASSTSTSTTTTTTTSTTSTDEKIKNFKIIGFNDFHGLVNDGNVDPKYMGVSRLSTFMKEEKAKQTTFAIAAGDVWAGQIESNYNHGKYVTECFNEMGLDAMCLGNHEFDWDKKYIIENQKVANFPFLTSNIRDSNGNLPVFADSDHVVLEKDGIKIGVVGSIDPSCKNDILATRVKEYTFEDRLAHVKKAANSARSAGADFIVLADHGKWETTASFTNIIDQCGINLVFAAHSHEIQKLKHNNVPILQAKSEGSHYDNVNLTFNTITKEIKIISANVEEFNTASYRNDLNIDKNYNDNYRSIIDGVKNAVVGSLDKKLYAYDGYGKKGKLPRLAAEAGFNSLLSTEPTLKGFVHNQGRKSLESSPELTYGDIYNSLPFENVIVTFKAKGSVIKSMCSGNNRYVNKDFNKTDLADNTIYTFSGIDYVVYKYEDKITDIKIDNENKFIRDYVVDYIKNVKKGVVTEADIDW
ncbi:MAG: metallophosphoesterase [Bacilli bacterium]